MKLRALRKRQPATLPDYPQASIARCFWQKHDAPLSWPRGSYLAALDPGQTESVKQVLTAWLYAGGLALANLGMSGMLDGTNTTPRIDRAHLARQTFGDKAFEAEILGLFLAECRRQIANLKSAADEKAWILAGHTLKGSGRTIGAEAFAKLSERAESQPFLSGDDARKPLIAAIEAEFALLVKEIGG